jgi:N-acetylglucosaminyldiphosphoundecaprenol N-acetyl-beta-D-mannosaminyltransferase
MSIYQEVPILGYSVFCDKLEDIKLNHKALVINTLNAYSYIIAKKDDGFRNALKSSDILVPDGFPIVIASRFINGRKIKKIAGEDIYLYMCKYLNSIAGSCFFLGATPETLQKIISKLNCQFPNIKASSYSPPFRESFSEEENNEIIKTINDFSPMYFLLA